MRRLPGGNVEQATGRSGLGRLGLRGRLGGLRGRLGLLGLFGRVDGIDREGTIEYEFSFTFGSVVAATWEIHWQEIRD